MLRPLLLALALAGAPAAAQESQPAPETQDTGAPLTREAVAEAAKAGIAFVSHAHITDRQAANPDLLLFDVRSEGDYAMGRIPGATSMPRGVAEFRIAEEVRDADAEIIVYCATGSRAALVKEALDAQGYRNVSAHSGFESWAGDGQPVENAYGTFRLIERAEKD